MNHLIFLLICLSITRALTTVHDGQAPPSSPCPYDNFDCGSGELHARCIPHYWVCDNIHDCTSGADELQCKRKYFCGIGRFMCPNGDCYDAHQRCDGLKNCLDGYDEVGCAATPKHPVGGPISDGKLRKAISTTNKEEGSRVGSSLLLAFGIILLMLLAMFITRWALQRYPNTASRVDHTLKEFNRNVIQPWLMQRSSPSRANITLPPFNEHYFENPMNTVQEPPHPLMVTVTSTAGAGSTSPVANASRS